MKLWYPPKKLTQIKEEYCLLVIN